MRGDGTLRQHRQVGATRDRRYVWRLQVSTGERTPSGSVRKVSRLHPSDGSGCTEAEAREALRRFAAEVAAQRRVATGRLVTVDDLIADHLAKLPARQRAQSTIESYQRYAAAWISPYVGKVRIERATKRDLDAVLQRMIESGRSPSAVNQVRAILSGAFKRACEDGLLERSPMEHVRRVRVAARPMQLPDEATVGALLRAAEAEGDVTHLAIRLAAVLGARRGELAALRWEHVDVDAGTVSVLGALGYAGGRVIAKSTKAHDLRIGLAVDAATVDLLRRVGAQARGPWVLSSDAGLTPWSPDRLSSRWEAVRAAVPAAAGVRLHDLRHWAATTLLDAGVPAHEVARRLGHASSIVTQTVYAHARGREDRAHADTLARALAIPASAPSVE